jgi:hypothetical protein
MFVDMEALRSEFWMSICATVLPAPRSVVERPWPAVQIHE